jgi:hypothetical protein
MGYCDEPYGDYERCPIGKKRPHKRDLFAIYDAYRKGEFPLGDRASANNEELDEGDFRIIEDEKNSV